MPSITLHQGDNLEVLATIPDNSIDAIVTDPPYGLSDHGTADVVECLAAWMAGQPYVTKKAGGFMNRSWDAWVPGPEVWRECYRVLKPGGYLLCFASTRTDDLMSIAIRLAGFRKHPFFAWIFGQGMPKATNLSMMIEKRAGADHATPETQEWEGWYYGLQSLRPAVEPILMFQKHADRGMVDNVLHWGTGAMNIDACRVKFSGNGDGQWTSTPGKGTKGKEPRGQTIAYGYFGNNAEPKDQVCYSSTGRWPANVVTDGSPEVVDEFPITASGKPGIMRKGTNDGASYGAESRPPGTPMTGFGDEGSAARFFFQAKDVQSTPKPSVNTNRDGEASRDNRYSGSGSTNFAMKPGQRGGDPSGRWPPNVVIDGSPEIVDEFPMSDGRGGQTGGRKGTRESVGGFGHEAYPINRHNDTGSSARFMYQAKAGRSERWFLCRDCAAVFPGGQRDDHGHGHVDAQGRQTWQHIRQHETQKPVALMRWLVKLVTPPGGTVLDPFVGSGSTLEAAELEGFNGIGIDREADFIEIARARIGASQLPLFATAVESRVP